MDKKYICPVCGFIGLDQPAFDEKGIVENHSNCPSCGFEFGFHNNVFAAGGYPETYTDKDMIIAYRKKWIKNGMKWIVISYPQPKNWDPKKQLENIPEEFK